MKPKQSKTQWTLRRPSYIRDMYSIEKYWQNIPSERVSKVMTFFFLVVGQLHQKNPAINHAAWWCTKFHWLESRLVRSLRWQAKQKLIAVLILVRLRWLWVLWIYASYHGTISTQDDWREFNEYRSSKLISIHFLVFVHF